MCSEALFCVSTEMLFRIAQRLKLLWLLSPCGYIPYLYFSKSSWSCVIRQLKNLILNILKPKDLTENLIWRYMMMMQLYILLIITLKISHWYKCTIIFYTDLSWIETSNKKTNLQYCQVSGEKLDLFFCFI